MMGYDPRQWSFIADMNYSGNITISDVWLWFKWLYFLPGDGLLYFLIHKMTKIAEFFEITFDSYGGFLSGTVSLIVWVIVWLLVATVND